MSRWRTLRMATIASTEVVLFARSQTRFTVMASQRDELGLYRCRAFLSDDDLATVEAAYDRAVMWLEGEAS